MSSNHILRLAVAMALAGASGTALAQNPPGSDQSQTEMETIVVTGSYIRGAAEETALPVDVIGTEDLIREGAPTVTEMIKSLPSVGAVLGDSNQFNGATAGFQGVSNINMRAIGGQRTLILLNGRRTNTDINMMPMMVVSQMEILKEGAASTYGSDAIAGVVNFITRKNFDGLELTAGYTHVPDSADDDYQASLIYGHQGDNGGILFGAAYQHRSELKSTARDWSYRPYLENPTGWSGASNPGFYQFVNTPNVAPASAVVGSPRVDANCAALGGFQGWAGSDPRCYFYYVPFDNLVEESNRYQLYTEANASISDATNLRFEATFARTALPDYRVSPGYNVSNGPTGPGTPYFIPSTNPGYATFLAQTGGAAPAGAIGVRAGVPTWRPIAQGGNPIMGGTGGMVREVYYDSFRAVGELSGMIFQDIGWNTALTYLNTSNHQEGPDILIQRLDLALRGLGGSNCRTNTPGANGCQYYNPFSNAVAGNPAVGLTNPGFVPANANDPNLIAWMFDYPRTDVEYNAFIFDAVLTGELPWSLPGGAIGWAGGVQARTSETRTALLNRYQDQRVFPCPNEGQTNCTIPTGPYIFLGQGIPTYLRDKIYAGFGELNLPILDTLNAQLSVRYEDYGGLTGSTTNPKLSAKWQIIDPIAIRASVGTTFRGPTPGNRALTGTTQFTAIAVAGNQSTAIDAFGNPAVGPEEATTMNFGTILTFGDFRATIDAWAIKLKDQITTAGTGPAIAAAVAPSSVVNCNSPLAYLITFSQPCVNGMSGTNIVRIRIDTTNGADLEVQGLDIAADYEFDVLGSNAMVGVSGTYMHKYEQEAFLLGGILPVTPAFDAVGKLNFNEGVGSVPRWRGYAFAEYSPGIHSIRLDATYVGGVKDNRAPVFVQTGPVTAACTVATASQPNCRRVTFGNEIDDWIRLNLTYSVDLAEDLTLSASVNNIFDTDPPEVRMEYSYDPNMGDPLGRTFRVNIRKQF